MKTVIDSNAGFCFGVVKAIGTAEDELSRSDRLFCLGDIVHNSAEVLRLRQKGLEVINHDEFAQLRNTRVLIRAHGEPPSTYTIARDHGVTLIDATCPIVLALQQKVRKGYYEMKRVDGQVVIFGKPGHAEVIGLNGQTDNTAIIVSSPDDIETIDFSRPIRLYSQTTKSREQYEKLKSNIAVRANDFVAHDTICGRVANRTGELRQFAQSVDLLLFVCGTNSSNGRYLYEYSRQFQPNTHMIAATTDINAAWFSGVTTVGISGATSTPRWLMEEVKTAIDHNAI